MDEFFVDGNASFRCAELSSAARGACNQLQNAVKSVFVLYNVPFQEHVKAVEYTGEYFIQGAHAVICRPLNSTHEIAKLSNFDHYRLNLLKMSQFVELFPVLMDLSAHGHISVLPCSLRPDTSCW